VLAGDGHYLEADESEQRHPCATIKARQHCDVACLTVFCAVDDGSVNGCRVHDWKRIANSSIVGSDSLSFSVRLASLLNDGWSDELRACDADADQPGPQA
jgi:hypothetical protein